MAESYSIWFMDANVTSVAFRVAEASTRIGPNYPRRGMSPHVLLSHILHPVFSALPKMISLIDLPCQLRVTLREITWQSNFRFKKWPPVIRESSYD